MSFSKYKPETLKIHDWYAYPEYTVPQKFVPFVIEETDEGAIFYANAVEQIAGAMEMSAIAGRNVANLCWSWLKNNK